MLAACKKLNQKLIKKDLNVTTSQLNSYNFVQRNIVSDLHFSKILVDRQTVMENEKAINLPFTTKWKFIVNELF